MRTKLTQKNAHLETTIDLSPILTKEGEAGVMVDHAIAAAMTIIESAYVQEAPVNFGDFRKGIEVHKIAFLNHEVRSTAREQGRNYPLSLFTGTGKLYGAPDFGFTTGHVRAGTVEWGIGGIRPNKAATRAKNKSEVQYMMKVKQLVNKAIEES